MKKMIIGTFTLLIILAGSAVKKPASAQKNATITYDLRFPNAAHNEAEVTLTLTNLSSGPIGFTMSRTSPGRYALHEFAKNVYNVRALDANGDTLDVHHPDLHNWEVAGHNGTVKFMYTLYADHADGTYSGINREHAHLNMPATLAWAPALKNQPVTVRFHPPEGSNWKVATQLQPTDDPFMFKAPDYYYLMDSPTELSNFGMKTWTVADDTAGYTMRLALHHNGTREQLNSYAAMAQKVVSEQIAVYGEPASYDYGTYTFIADYLPYVFGDGMEHRNSTILTSSRSLNEGAMRNLGTLSHEFFHSWNVERIRPKSLEPFDFTKANVSGALWFAEGFTSYYDDLIIRRTGLTNNKEYAQGWGGTLNYVLNSPGSNYYSPVEMSRQAPFVDAARSIDQQNKANTFISYYSWGSVLGLGLDLTLRTTFENITLDDYMRAMWKNYGKPEKPYTLEDLQTTLGEVTGDAAFAENFFDRYIYGKELVDLKPLLTEAGFQLQKEHAGQVVLSFSGNAINFEKAEPTVSSNTVWGSPLYKAGIDREDIILKIDGQEITNAQVLQRLLNKHKPGDTVSITYRSVGQEYESEVTLAEDPTLQLVPFEELNKNITPEIKSFRESWLGSKVKK